jgi:hypothetical protein
MNSKTMALTNAWVGVIGRIYPVKSGMCAKRWPEPENFADASEQTDQVGGTESGTGPIPGQSTD